MNTQNISKEWIDTFNHLGSEGKLKAPVDYHAIFEADELFGKKTVYIADGTCNFAYRSYCCL